MRKLACIGMVVGFFFVSSANAEYCWMVGCKDREGFIFTYIIKNGNKESVFKGKELPSKGSEATLAAFIAMSDSPPTKYEDGPYNLGPGFVVKVLGYIGSEKEIVHIKIISDDLK